MNIRFPTAHYDALAARAEKRNCPVQDVILEAIMLCRRKSLVIRPADSRPVHRVDSMPVKMGGMRPSTSNPQYVRECVAAALRVWAC